MIGWRYQFLRPFAMYFCLFFYTQTAGLAGYVRPLLQTAGRPTRVRPCLSLRFSASQLQPVRGHYPD
jgi:hypothetical protein